MNVKAIGLVIVILAASISAFVLYRPFGIMDDMPSQDIDQINGDVVEIDLEEEEIPPSPIPMDGIEVPHPDFANLGPIGIRQELGPSVDEAMNDARSKGFTLRLLELPDISDLSIRHFSLGASSFIVVYYGKVPINSDGDVFDFMATGGLELIVQKAKSGHVESLEAHPTFRVNGLPVHVSISIPNAFPEPKVQINWIDGEEFLILFGSSNQYSIEDLIRLAESIPSDQ